MEEITRRSWVRRYWQPLVIAGVFVAIAAACVPAIKKTQNAAARSVDL